jgi:hypothetical protein
MPAGFINKPIQAVFPKNIDEYPVAKKRPFFLLFL